MSGKAWFVAVLLLLLGAPAVFAEGTLDRNPDGTAVATAEDPAKAAPSEAAEPDAPEKTEGPGGKEEKKAHEGGHSQDHDGGHGASSRLTDQHIPLQLDDFPQRPKPFLELGEPFLGTGTLDPGFRLPTGAVWQPSLLGFGQLRTAFQAADTGTDDVAEIAARLDLFFNLQLSGSERLVLGFRNLDQDGRFTSYRFDSGDLGGDDRFQDEFNAEIGSLFFEGDFGEIFPNLSREDFRATDIGFSIGRQPLLFQEGMLIQDTLDAIGLTRNTLQPRNTSNFRATFLWAWNDVHRANVDDGDAQLFGVLTSTDFRRSTVDVDAAYVRSDETAGDQFSLGVSAVQRLGKFNTSFRVLSSFALDEETAFATDGTLLFSEVSWTPHYSHDLMYFTTFWAIDAFSSAARGPSDGGPLGRAGINFAAVGLGSYGAALSSQARDVVGGAFGYQHFFDHTRKQLIWELGARIGTDDAVGDAFAATGRYQMAIGRRLVLVVDAFVGYQDAIDETGYGGRLELVTKF